MVRRSLVSLVLVLCCAAVCFAGDFNGLWEGSVKMPDGQELQLAFTFKVDGENVTGTVRSPMGEVPISNGKIKGDEITFDVEFGPNKIGHLGTLKDDAIDMKSHGPWGDSQFMLKHSAQK
jgi:hypothetical protein